MAFDNISYDRDDDDKMIEDDDDDDVDGNNTKGVKKTTGQWPIFFSL